MADLLEELLASNDTPLSQLYADASHPVQETKQAVASAACSSIWAEWSYETLNSVKTEPTPVQQRRERNREAMRKARQRKREQVLQLRDTVEELEKRYKQMSETALTTTGAGELDDEARRLGAENLHLRTAIQNMQRWKHRLFHLFEASSTSPARSTSASMTTQKLEQEEMQAAFGYTLMTCPAMQESASLSRDSMMDLRERLSSLEAMEKDKTTMLSSSSSFEDFRSMDIFDWQVNQVVRGKMAEFTFKKLVKNVRPEDVMQTTWNTLRRVDNLSKIQPEVRRLDILQDEKDVYVVGRDAQPRGSSAVLRSLLLTYKQEVSKSDERATSGHGYVIGIQSMNGRKSASQSPVDGGVVWMDVEELFEFIQVNADGSPVDEADTSERWCEIRFTSRTKCTNASHAYRCARETLNRIIRWGELHVNPILYIN